MGHKIFISYKYADNDVSRLNRTPWGEETTVRDYVDEFQEMLEDSDHINKGEKDGEDLSNFKESTIESKLRDKIFDSSITVVFISPNMFDRTIDEKDQWIPWEINYSLKIEKRQSGRSLCNGMIAVVIPDKSGSYNYMLETHNCYKCCGCTTHYTNKLFSILRDNMFNKKLPSTGSCTSYGKLYYGDQSYIKMVSWETFKSSYNSLIEEADAKKDNVYNYIITTY